MWMALAFLFVTSSTVPPGTVTGIFPGRFATEADCKAFLDKRRKEATAPGGDTVLIQTRTGTHRATVIRREFRCVKNEGGQKA